MATSAESKSKPWDFNPVSWGRYGCLAPFASFILCLLMIGGVMGGVLLPILFLFTTSIGMSWTQILAMVIVYCPLGFASYKGFMYLNRNSTIEGHLSECSERHAVYVLGGWTHLPLRQTAGIGSVDFENEKMVLKMDVGPHIAWLLIPIISLSLKFFLGVMVTTLSTAVLALCIYFVLCSRTKRELCIESSMLEKVHCQGPVVKVKLTQPPFLGLRIIEFLVPPDQGFDFFANFEQVFPEKLPSAYREALSQHDDNE